MLHGTRRYTADRLSFEKPDNRRHPERIMAKPGRRVIDGGCPLCGGAPHPAWRCDLPVDEPLAPDAVLGAITHHEPKRPVPIDEYRGPGRVLVLPLGVFGDDLQREKIADVARTASLRRSAARGRAARMKGK